MHANYEIYVIFDQDLGFLVKELLDRSIILSPGKIFESDSVPIHLFEKCKNKTKYSELDCNRMGSPYFLTLFSFVEIGAV